MTPSEIALVVLHSGYFVHAKKLPKRPRLIVIGAPQVSQISSVAITRVVPDPASYVPGVTMPAEVVLTIGWNVLSHVELEPAHCGDENCEADHGYMGTITADDLTLRMSEAADGEDGVRQVLSFAAALSDATTASGGR